MLSAECFILIQNQKYSLVVFCVWVEQINGVCIHFNRNNWFEMQAFCITSVAMEQIKLMSQGNHRMLITAGKQIAFVQNITKRLEELYDSSFHAVTCDL